MRMLFYSTQGKMLLFMHKNFFVMSMSKTSFVKKTLGKNQMNTSSTLTTSALMDLRF